jgi:hypothetical protein
LLIAASRMAVHHISAPLTWTSTSLLQRARRRRVARQLL